MLLMRRLRWLLVALMIAQGLGAREALGQVRQGAPHHKAKAVNPVRKVDVPKPKNEVTIISGAVVFDTPPNPDYDSGPDEQGAYSYVKQMPTYNGSGTAAITARIQQNVHSRNDFGEDFTGGRIFMSFVIDTSGRVKNPIIIKGLGRNVDDEVLRAVQNMAGFTPGKHDGRPVDVLLTIPINFPEPKP